MQRCRPVLLAVTAFVTTSSIAGLATPAAAAVTIRRTGEQPIASAADESARRRVRGDRSANASIHGGWTPAAYDPDASHRVALAAFEAEVLGPSSPEAAEGTASAPGVTIVGSAPEPWMKRLALPDLPVRWNEGLVAYLNYFTKDERGVAMMRAWLRRAGRYEHRIRAILREHDVPESLVWVVMAESGFDPRVRSAVGAAGPWQFMEGTGGVYGLSKSYWVDWRFDIERSSAAAADYLADLRVRFGSWELALAAYNAGYGLVTTAIERHNTNNFWALCEIESGLPHATVNYVPKILAAAIVAKNRAELGFSDTAISPLPAIEWTHVEVEHSTTLASLARLGDVDVELLAELNAHLVRGRTPPRTRTKVRMPKAASAKLATRSAELEQLGAQWEPVEIAEGERLSELAARHGVTEKQLRADNGIRDAAEVSAGVTLVVPRNGAAAPVVASTRPLAAVPAVEVGTNERLVFFEVTRASTPSSIARAFGRSWERIVADNDLDPQARLQSAQILQIIVPRAFDAKTTKVAVLEPNDVEHVIRGSREHIEASLARRNKLRRGVKAKRGETLEAIGRRYDLTTGDLARINGYPRDHALATGEIVIVYVDEGRTKGTVDAPPPASAIDAATGATEPNDTGASDDEPTKPSTPVVSETKKPKAGGRRKSDRAPSTASSSRVPLRRRGSK